MEGGQSLPAEWLFPAMRNVIVTSVEVDGEVADRGPVFGAGSLVPGL
ncbi:hypothetical protein ACWGR4_35620 [Embleya sp. NPDC055664]